MSDNPLRGNRIASHRWRGEVRCSMLSSILAAARDAFLIYKHRWICKCTLKAYQSASPSRVRSAFDPTTAKSTESAAALRCVALVQCVVAAVRCNVATFESVFYSNDYRTPSANSLSLAWRHDTVPHGEEFGMEPDLTALCFSGSLESEGLE